METCKTTGCDRPVYVKKTSECRKHYAQRWYIDNAEKVREHARGYVRPEGLTLVPRKAEVGYFQAHRRVKVARGHASLQACVDCGLEAQEWALIHGQETHWQDVRGYDLPYSLDPMAYQAKCIRCHRAEDNAR